MQIAHDPPKGDSVISVTDGGGPADEDAAPDGEKNRDEASAMSVRLAQIHRETERATTATIRHEMTDAEKKAEVRASSIAS
jgi:hypothetical protein